jgi:hypothetical protein
MLQLLLRRCGIKGTKPTVSKPAAAGELAQGELWLNNNHESPGLFARADDDSLIEFAPEKPFLQDGANAKPRTYLSKLKDVVSVKDFGAVANGDFATGAGTDNTAAFQAAINSLTGPLNGGRTLHIPAGVYKLNSAITIPSGVSVIGDGPWNSVLFAPTAFSNTAGLVQLNGVGGPPTSWEGISVLAQTGGCSGYGLVSTANGVLIRRLWCSGYTVGVVLGAQTGMLLSDAFIELNTTNLLIQGSDIQVSDVEVYAGQNGVTISNNAFVAGNGRVTLTNVQAAAAMQNGFALSGAKNVALIGCSAAHTNSARLSNAGLLIDSCNNITVVGFDGQIGSTPSATSTGIKVVNSTQVGISAGSAKGFYDGVVVSSGSTDVIIDGMNCADNARSGIYLNGGTRLTASSNQCRSNGAAGVNEYGISSTNSLADGIHLILGNICSAAAGGVQDYGIAATVSTATGRTTVDANVCQNNNVADILLGAGDSGDIKYGDNIASIVIDVSPPSLASAATLTLPRGANTVSVTGTTGITSIVAAGNARRTVTLIFADALTVTDGSNLKLAGNFTTTADDVLTLYCDGTYWIEVSRSVN